MTDITREMLEKRLIDLRAAQIDTLYRFSQLGEKWGDTQKMAVMGKNKHTSLPRSNERRF